MSNYIKDNIIEGFERKLRSSEDTRKLAYSKLDAGLISLSEYNDIVNAVSSDQPCTREMYEQEVERLIRQKYSLNQELALHRQRETKVQEFQEYFDYCEECKQEARIALNMVE